MAWFLDLRCFAGCVRNWPVSMRRTRLHSPGGSSAQYYDIVTQFRAHKADREQIRHFTEYHADFVSTICEPKGLLR
eukprot:1257671-Pleurochrysis_carterae.AAC.1